MKNGRQGRKMKSGGKKSAADAVATQAGSGRRELAFVIPWHQDSTTRTTAIAEKALSQSGLKNMNMQKIARFRIRTILGKKKTLIGRAGYNPDKFGSEASGQIAIFGIRPFLPLPRGGEGPMGRSIFKCLSNQYVHTQASTTIIAAIMTRTMIIERLVANLIDLIL